MVFHLWHVKLKCDGCNGADNALVNCAQLRLCLDYGMLGLWTSCAESSRRWLAMFAWLVYNSMLTAYICSYGFDLCIVHFCLSQYCYVWVVYDQLDSHQGRFYLRDSSIIFRPRYCMCVYATGIFLIIRTRWVEVKSQSSHKTLISYLTSFYAKTWRVTG